MPGFKNNKPKDTSSKDVGQALKVLLADKAAPGALLVISPDRVRRERIVHSLLKKFCKGFHEKTHKAENLDVINCENINSTNLQSILDNINSISLFSPQRFFLINNVEALTAALNKKLLDVVQAKNPDTYLFFASAKLASNSVFFNHFKKANALLELEELKNLDLNRWTQKELKNAGINTWDEILVESIIQSTESDPDKIVELIEKLSLYTDGDKATLSDLSKLSKQAPDASEFALLDYLPNKKLAWKSELLVTQIFDAGKNSFALLGLIARTYNSYLQIAYLRERGMSLQQIRQKLNISPWIFNKQAEACKNYSSKQLQKCLKAILLADSKLKNKSLGDLGIFSELIHNL